MLALTVALSSACIEGYNGSKVELFLHGGVQIPGDDSPGFGRPPSDSHYEIYVVKDDAPFHLADFDIRPVIKRSDPCFIEDVGSRFPGLHSTMIVDKLKAAAMADGDVSALEAGDIAVAKVRVANMISLEAVLKVLSVHEAGLTEKAIGEMTAQVPAADQIDDGVNAQRLAACQALWKQHPGYYVGTDKVLTIPLNGTYIGLVEAMDPRSGSLLGGGMIDVPAAFPGFDAMRVNWSFNDPNDPRRASLPPSTIGWHYMAGKALPRVRDVVNVHLVNNDFAQISGEVSVYTQLVDDDVHF